MTTLTAVLRTAPERTVLRVAALTTTAALATNLSLFGAARAADIGFEFAKPGSAAGTETVSVGAVLAATVLTMAMGWTVVALAAWRHRPSLRTMAILGGVIAAVSVAAPLALDAELGARLILASLHLITGTFFVTGIAGLRRADARATR